MSQNFRVKCIQNIEGRSGALISLGTFPSLADGWRIHDGRVKLACLVCLKEAEVYIIDNNNVEFIHFQILKI